MKRLVSTLTAPFKQVYPHERMTCLLSALFSFGAVALAIFIRTWSDTLFLTHFPVDRLPVFFIWSAFAFAPVTMGYTWLSKRVSPIRLNTATLILFGASCLLCIHPSHNRLYLFITLLLMSLVSPLVNAICWGVILERLSSLQSKRLIPLISSAATIGAVSAGLFAAEIIEWGGLVALMGTITLTLLALACLPSALLISTPTPNQSVREVQDESSGHKSKVSPAQSQQNLARSTLTRTRYAGWLSQLKTLCHNRLLLITAIATLMMAINTNLIDYLFKAEIQNKLTHEGIGPFLARFHATTNAFILGVQLFILSRLNERIGLKWSFPLYPISLVVTSLFCFTPLGWLSFVALRGIDTLMKFTVHSNAENLVLTPVSLVLRTQVKVLLKGAIYPLGGLIAGLVIWLIANVSRVHELDPIPCALSVTLILCLIWIFTTLRVHIFYWEQLATNLGLPKAASQRMPRTHTLDQLLTLLEQSNQTKYETQLDRNLHSIDEQIISLIIDSFDLAGHRDKIHHAWHEDHQLRADLVAWVGLSSAWQGYKEVGPSLERHIDRHRVHTGNKN